MHRTIALGSGAYLGTKSMVSSDAACSSGVKGGDMTATLGFDKPLYILAFDYRDLLVSMSEADDMLTPAQAASMAAAKTQVTSAKHIVYDAFEAALASGVPKDKAAILIDEQFGADILVNASEKGYLTGCPAEKSGQGEFDFEYGEDFAKHIETFHPAFCKAEIRYNPESDRDLNQRQLARLKRLSDYLHRETKTLFLLELVIPPEKTQLKKLNGNRKSYDAEMRPGLTVDAIRQLQEAQVEPDVWRIEGLDRREDCEKVVAAARSGGRDKVGCLILSGTRNQESVGAWVKTAAAVPGFIGFAAGRTVFAEPLSRWAVGESTYKSTANVISRKYREFVDIFEAT